MSKELSPKYNPAEVEAGRYQKWLDEDVFKPSGDKKAKPYSIVIPSLREQTIRISSFLLFLSPHPTH